MSLVVACAGPQRVVDKAAVELGFFQFVKTVFE